ncbi:hypothetical protein BH10ACT1_BH10ACT1_35570 [soil metagenome]
MKKLLVVVALVLATLAFGSAAGAHQYPPRDPGSVQGADADQGFGSGSGGAVSGAGAGNGGAPLARTGSDVVPLALLGVALVGAGAFWVVASRSRRTVAP